MLSYFSAVPFGVLGRHRSGPVQLVGFEGDR